jgi:hypothetical protein
MTMNTSSIPNNNPGIYQKVAFSSDGQWIGLILGILGVLVLILLGVLYVFSWDPKRRKLKKARLRREIEEELYATKAELHSNSSESPELDGGSVRELDTRKIQERELDSEMVVELEGDKAMCEIEGTMRAELKGTEVDLEKGH